MKKVIECILLLLGIYIIVFFTGCGEKSDAYETAMELYDAGEYESAIVAFEQLEGYKDSDIKKEESIKKLEDEIRNNFTQMTWKNVDYSLQGFGDYIRITKDGDGKLFVETGAYPRNGYCTYSSGYIKYENFDPFNFNLDVTLKYDDNSGEEKIKLASTGDYKFIQCNNEFYELYNGLDCDLKEFSSAMCQACDDFQGMVGINFSLDLGKDYFNITRFKSGCLDNAEVDESGNSVYVYVTCEGQCRGYGRDPFNNANIKAKFTYEFEKNDDGVFELKNRAVDLEEI